MKFCAAGVKGWVLSPKEEVHPQENPYHQLSHHSVCCSERFNSVVNLWQNKANGRTQNLSKNASRI